MHNQQYFLFDIYIHEVSQNKCEQALGRLHLLFLSGLVMSVLWLQLPGAFVSPLAVVRPDFPHNFFQVGHRLFGDVHQVLDVVILVLLKGREEHVQHDLPLGPHHLPLRLLLLLVLHIEIVIGHRLEDGSDGSLQLL